MENNHLNIIKEFLVKNQLVNPKKINEEITLCELGIDGDDVYETMVDFFEEFGIEYKNTDYMDYIPREPITIFPILGLIIHLFYKPKLDLTKEIQIKDMIHSLKIKKWEKLK